MFDRTFYANINLVPRSLNPIFGERLTEAMNAPRIPYSDSLVANSVGVSQSRIQSYKKGTYPYDEEAAKLLPELAYLLDVNVEWLAGDDFPMRPVADRIDLEYDDIVDIRLREPSSPPLDGEHGQEEEDGLRIKKVGKGAHHGFTARDKGLSPLVIPGDGMVYAKLEIAPGIGDVVYCVLNGVNHFGVLRRRGSSLLLDTITGLRSPLKIVEEDIVGVCVITERIGLGGSVIETTYPSGLNVDLFSQKVAEDL